MPDNPNKKARDRKFVSQQPHEQVYQKRSGNSSGNSGGKGKRSSRSQGSSSRQNKSGK